MLTCHDLTMKFGSLTLFEHIDLSFDRGQLNVLTGESGSGKSTLLNILAGYQRPTGGTISYDGRIATIFQNYELIDDLSVFDNIFFGQTKPTRSQYQLLNYLGLEPLLHAYPKELSGGQQQRVGIARALLQKPDIILCDEPTESLDYANKDLVMDLLYALSGSTIVIVATHDQRLLANYPAKRYHLENHQFTIIESPLVEPKASIKLKRVKPNLTRLVKRMYIKTTLVTSLIFTTLLTIILASLVVYHHLFYIPTTTYSIDANRLYFQTNDINQARITLNVLTATKIMDMRYVKINDQFYSLMPLPYTNDGTFPLEGSINGLDMIINDHCIDYGLTMGSTIEVVNYYKTNQSTIPVNISGIVEEKDRNGCAIYYDLDQWKAYYDTLEENEPYLFQDIATANQWYMIDIHDHDLNELYQRANEDGLTIVQPLYDQRIEMMQQRRPWSLLFGFILIIAIILLGISSALYLTQEGKYLQKKSCILAINHVDLTKLRIGYGLIKGLPIAFYWVVYTIVMMVLPKETMVLFNLSLSTWLIMITSSISIIHLIVILINVFSIRNQRIAELLKSM